MICSSIGDHLSSLGDNKQPVTPTASSTVQLHSPDGAAEIISRSEAEQRKKNQDEDARVKSILADSELRETLLDSRIQRLMEALRNNPEEAQR